MVLWRMNRPYAGPKGPYGILAVIRKWGVSVRCPLPSDGGSVQSPFPSLSGAVFLRGLSGPEDVFGPSRGRDECDLDTSDFRHRSSVVEHTLGKGEVTGSNPVGGLDTMLL